MNTNAFRLWLAAVVLLVASPFTRAENSKPDVPVAASKPAEAILDNLLSAFAKSDYDAYTRDLNETSRKALNKDEFERSAKATAALFGEYQSRTYLGSLKTQGYVVHLWRARFKASTDDVLINLSLTPDEAKPLVGGFWLQ